MPKWNEFIPSQIEYDFENDELGRHRIDIDEAIQCFFNEFTIRRNKRYKDRYKLIGESDGGRKLCIIFQIKRKTVVRIITGWGI